jgi:hypothetical protein
MILGGNLPACALRRETCGFSVTRPTSTKANQLVIDFFGREENFLEGCLRFVLLGICVVGSIMI